MSPDYPPPSAPHPHKQSPALVIAIALAVMAVLGCCVVSNMMTARLSGTGLGSGNVVESDTTRPVKSFETTAQQEARLAESALEKTRKTPEYERLTDGGMSDAQALSFIEAADVAAIEGIDKVVSSGRDKSGDVFLVRCPDGEITMDYGVIFKKNKVSEIRDEHLSVLYSAGKRNKKYHFWAEFGGPTQLQTYAKTGIQAILKAPSTAKFPGSFLDPFDGWGFKKKGRDATVTSYVDSENSFGAMIRSRYKLIFRLGTGKKADEIDLVYVNFDGHVEDHR